MSPCGPRSTVEAAVAQWAARPIAEVVDHIVARYHAPLKVQLAELTALAPALGELADRVALFAEELSQHLVKEERVAFQMLRAAGGYEGVAFGVMQHEHTLIDRLLDELRELTAGWRPSAGAPEGTARALALLADIDADLPEHSALEEDLFARVRAASRGR